MGQKVSPEIFRLESLNKNWKSKYIENKTRELSAFFFKSLEIKKFIKQFLKFYGLTLHNCKTALSNNSVHLIISYYVTNRASILINRQNVKNNIKIYFKKEKKRVIDIIKNILKMYYCKCFKTLKKKKFIRLKKKIKSNNLYLKKKKFVRFKKKIQFNYLYLKKKVKKQLKKKITRIKHFENSRYFRRHLYYIMQLVKKKFKTKKLRSKYVKKTKEKFNILNYKNTKNVKKIGFAENFLENLSKFLRNNYSLFVTLKNLKINNIKESYSNKDRKVIKKKLSFKLHRYKKSDFFKLAKRTIILAVKKMNSAQFLANFIAFQLNRLKKEQYFFLKCVKVILTMLLKGTKAATKLSGIKIVIKGRLKKARRAKRKTFKITIGRIPLQSIHSNINHAKATSYTPNGTFGTEIWINYYKTKQIERKKNFKNQFLKFFYKKKNSQHMLSSSPIPKNLITQKSKEKPEFKGSPLSKYLLAAQKLEAKFLGIKDVLSSKGLPTQKSKEEPGFLKNKHSTKSKKKKHVPTTKKTK